MYPHIRELEQLAEARITEWNERIARSEKKREPMLPPANISKKRLWKIRGFLRALTFRPDRNARP